MGELRSLGDYNIIKQIGNGSLGGVYLAEHRFMLQQYAIKVLAEDLTADRSFLQRFEEDVANLAALDHPNIVKIYNISFAQGRYFLVNDCVVDAQGETTNLAHYFLHKNKYLADAELLPLLRQIASALDYAHSRPNGATKGVAHRGVKLNNILVGKGEGSQADRFYLADFGLSRIVGSAGVLSRTYRAVADSFGMGWLTAVSGDGGKSPPFTEGHKLAALHASFLQSFPFLAPEQKRIEWAERVDSQADVYAFGVLSYYLLTGEFPEGHFVYPSKLRPQGVVDWDRLVCRCLHPEAGERPVQLMPLLEAHQGEILTPPKPPSTSIEAVVSSLLCLAKEEPRTLQQEILGGGMCEEIYCEAPAVIVAKAAAPGLTAAAAPAQIPMPAASTVSPAAYVPLLHPSQIERPVTDQNPAAVFQIDPHVKHYMPEKKEVKHIEPLLTDMAVIPERAYMRGSNEGNRDETPLHQVFLTRFAIDVHPVTNEQFVRFLEVMGGEKDSNHRDIIRLRDSRIKRSCGKLSIESGYSKHPVVGVTWYGAMAYARWVGKRLPTEAEWEVASRGGVDAALYPTGEDIEKSQANFFSSDTIAVMSYPPNGLGLYDMAGNVYEWCQDWYGYNYYEVSVQEPENPRGPLQGVYRVLRGGCWKSLKEDLRCSRRHRNNPGTVNGAYGFRCAADT